MRTHLLGFLFLLMSQMLSAQIIRGTIKDAADRSAISQVRVTAYSRSDSLSAYSDPQGHFALQPLSGMRVVRLTFSHMAYEPVELSPSAESFMEVYLNPKTTQLDEVVIKQEFLSRRDGNIIVNISRIPNVANLQTDQVLTRIPGVLKTGEGAYSLNGKSAVIYVNGVKQTISAGSLAAFLSSLPAGAVSSVELVPVNSGQYSATTEAVIDIKTTPNIPLGYSFQPSVHSSFFKNGLKDIGANLFYMTKVRRLLFHNTLSYTNERIYSDYLDSLLLADRAPIIQEGGRRGRTNVITYNASLLYTLPSSHRLTFNAFIYYDFAKPTLHWYTSLNKSIIQRKEHSDLYNFSLVYQIPSANLSFNGDIGYSFSYGGVYQEADYFRLDGERYNRSDVRMDGFLNTLYANLHSTFGDWKLHYGLQVDYNSVRDKSVYQDGRQSDFGGFEILPALYAQAQYRLSRHLGLKGSVRMETTHYQYNFGEEPVTKDYTSLFPSLLLNGDFSDYSFTSGLVSNIIRPRYQTMIPGLRQSSDYMYYSGNPDLKPCDGYGLIFNSTFFGYAQLNLMYAFVADNTGSVYARKGEYLIKSTENISDQQYFAVNALLPFSFWGDKLTGQLQAEGAHRKLYNFKHGFVPPLGRSTSYWSHSYNASVSYSPTVRVNVTLYGSYEPRYSSTLLESSWNTRWSLELYYSFLKERNLTLYLGAYDLFRRDNVYTSYFLDHAERSKVFSIGPSFKISLKYRLNKGQKVIEEYRDYTPNASRIR